MLNNFQVGQVLPTTKYLKISWTETSAQTFLELLMQIKTNTNKFNLVETQVKNVQSDFNPLDVDTNYDLMIAQSNLIASWNQSLNRSPEWLLECGDNGGTSCGIEKYIIINTLTWSTAKRTISYVSNALENIKWEDLAATNVLTVYFNSVGGTPIEAYSNVLTGTTIEAPNEPIKELFNFVGWFKENTYQNEWNFAVDTVTETITLYAKWDFVESFLDMATTTHAGIVQLSDAEDYDDLALSDDVITERVEKSVLKNIFDDIVEALEEVE